MVIIPGTNSYPRVRVLRTEPGFFRVARNPTGGLNDVTEHR
jgi:hypothetical protein